MGPFHVALALAVIVQWGLLSSALTDEELATFQTDSYKYPPDAVDASEITFYSSMVITNYAKYVWSSSAYEHYHHFYFNGIPNYSGVSTYDIWLKKGATNDEIQEFSISRCIPKNPIVNATGPYYYEGTVGLSIQGSTILTAEIPMANDTLDAEMDTCGGHASQNGLYHYHGWKDFTNLTAYGCMPNFDLSKCPSTIIGVALDGYPIYGPQICTKCNDANHISGTACTDWDDTPCGYYGQTTTSTTDCPFTALDDCGGRVPKTTGDYHEGDDSKGDYEYRLSYSDPWGIQCLYGETVTIGKCSSNTKRGKEEEKLENEERALENRLRDLLNKKK